MKRLLCIVGGMNTGGAETFLMKIYRVMDRNNFQMDFAVGIQDVGHYDEEILQLGGKIFHIPPKTRNPLASFNAIKKIVRDGHYESVLRISQNAMSSIDLLAAKSGGAKVLAFRSSNTGTCGNKIEDLVHFLFRPLAKVIPNVKLAPSSEAAVFMFGRKSLRKGEVYLIKNGLNIAEYTFNEEMRQAIRKENDWENKFVIGHIGRFNFQKNHDFIIKLAESLFKQNNNIHFVLVGEGERKKEIEKKCIDLKISSMVEFMGIRNDVSSLLMGFDLLVLPSLFEGMPNVAIEAQATGLPCILSDTITKEAKITDLINYQSINDVDAWCQNIEALIVSRKKQREIYSNELFSRGYDISDVKNDFVSLLYI